MKWYEFGNSWDVYVWVGGRGENKLTERFFIENYKLGSRNKLKWEVNFVKIEVYSPTTIGLLGIESKTSDNFTTYVREAYLCWIVKFGV